MPKTSAYTVHIVIQPAEDLPGQWLAHCLDFDVMSQGDSLRHAISMIREAVEMTLIHELAAGHDPTDKRAPQEEWDEMWSRLRSARPQSLAEAVEGEPIYVVLESVVTITGWTKAEIAKLLAGALPPPPVGFEVPLAFTPARVA